MNMVIELDQIKANFSTGLGGMSAVRAKPTALEKMDVHIITPEDRKNGNIVETKPPSMPFMPARSPSNKGFSPGIKRHSPGLKKPKVVDHHMGGGKPFGHINDDDSDDFAAFNRGSGGRK